MKPREVIQPSKEEKQIKIIKSKLKLPDDKEIKVSFPVPNNLDNLTISAAFSMRKGFASNTPYADEAGHVMVLVEALKPLRANKKLIVTDTLDGCNWHAYLVLIGVKRNQNPNSIHWPISEVNRADILSDDEVIDLFKYIDSQYQNKHEKMIFDEGQIVELLVEMFRIPAKKAGEKYIQEIAPIWEKLKKDKEDKSVRIVQWDQVLNELTAINEQGEQYNIVEEELRKLDILYKTDAEFKKGIDEENRYILNPKKYEEAGERLIEIIEDNPNEFQSDFLKKFTQALLVADFKKIGELSTLKYRFTELVQMMHCKNEIILYRGEPRSSHFRKFFQQKKIPFITIQFTGKDKARLKAAIVEKYEAAGSAMSQGLSSLPLERDSRESKQIIETSGQVIIVKDNLGEEKKREYKKDPSHDVSASSSSPLSTVGQVTRLLRAPTPPTDHKTPDPEVKPPSSRVVSNKSPSERHGLSLSIPGVTFPPPTPTTQALFNKAKLALAEAMAEFLKMELRIGGDGVSLRKMLLTLKAVQEVHGELAIWEDKNNSDKDCTIPISSHSRGMAF